MPSIDYTLESWLHVELTDFTVINLRAELANLQLCRQPPSIAHTLVCFRVSCAGSTTRTIAPKSRGPLKGIV